MATRFWVGGSGNWDASSTTHWAATTGGAIGASVPTSSDTVTFDANSGTTATVTITAPANASAVTINKSDITIVDNSGMTVTGAMTLTTGTLNTNGQTESWGSFSSSGTGTRTLTMGASNITLTSTGTAWNTATVNNLTITSNTATLILTGNGTTFTGGWGLSTNGMQGASISMTGGGNLNLISPGVIKNLTVVGTEVKTDNLSVTALTFNGVLTLTGNSAVNRLFIQSTTTGTTRSIVAGAGSSVSLSNVDFMDIAASGTGTPWTGTSLGDALGNSGITFTTPVDQHWISSSGGNWSDVANWTSRVPLPQDNVYIDANFSSGQIIFTDMLRLGANIDCTGATWSGTAPKLSGAASTQSGWYGSFIYNAGMLTTGSVAGNSWQARGRGTHDLDYKSVAMGPGITVSAPGGTYNLRCSYQQSNNSGINAGRYNTNGFDVTVVSTWTISGTAVCDFSTSTFTFTSKTLANALNITSNATQIADQATFVLSDSTVARNFVGGGNKFGTLDYTAAGSTGSLTITGNNTFSTIKFSDTSNARTLTFAAGSTNVIGTRNIFGTSGKLMTVNSSSSGTPAILVSRGSWNVGLNSTLVSGNSGLTIAASAEMDYLSISDITGTKTTTGNMFFGIM